METLVLDGWHQQMLMILQVILSFILGAVIGLEREYHGSAAGIRTYAAVSLGACVFGLISTHAQGAAYYNSIADPTRIAAQIVSGIGFLCAGVIFRDGMSTNGLTTAATIWATAAVGLAVAFDMFIISILATAIVFFLLILSHLPGWEKFTRKNAARKRRDKKAGKNVD